MSSIGTSLPLEVLPQQSVENAVDPVAVPPVRPPPDALAHEADPLRVVHRAFVEAVDLELEPVVVEVEEEMPIEHPRGLVRDSPAAEARIDCGRTGARPQQARPEGDPEQDQREAARLGGGDRLAEEDRAVEERRRR